MARNFAIEFSEKQSEACLYWFGIKPEMVKNKDKDLLQLIYESKQRRAIELLYGGAKYGGKSYGGCLMVYLEAIRLIKQYIQKKPEHPIPIGFMGRKVGKNFYETTFESWKKAIPGGCYRIKGQQVDIIIEDRVKILTGGLDSREVINQFNSAELAFYFLDQAEETLKDDISLLRTATFWRLSLGGVKIPGKGLLTANPAQCWLKQEFIDVAA